MNKPKIVKGDLEKLIASQVVPEPVRWVGIRGYFKDSMGQAGVNDLGIYDDAIILVGPDVYLTFNGNTDPSKSGKGIGMMKSNQTYYLEPGLHGISHLDIVHNSDHKAIYQKLLKGEDVPEWTRTYWAFRQASDIIVIRDGKEERDSPKNRFWVNLHCGGEWTTSSLACQTIIKSQWLDARAAGYAAMHRFQQKRVPYTLIDAQ